MTKPTILKEEEMPMFELSEEIAKIRKRDPELNFRVQKTEEYLNVLMRLKPKEARSLVDKLRKLNVPRMHDRIIYKIVDILPSNIEELKVLVQGYTITVNNDNLKRIVKTVSEFLPQRKK